MGIMDMIDYHEPWACIVCDAEYRHEDQGVGVDVNAGTGTCHACNMKTVDSDAAG